VCVCVCVCVCFFSNVYMPTDKGIACTDRETDERKGEDIQCMNKLCICPPVCRSS
jgi:hypothetical protein